MTARAQTDWKKLTPHSEDERLQKAVRLVLETAHAGREQAITYKDLTAHLAAHGFRRLENKNGSRAVRAAVERLRNQGVLICAVSGVGVFMAATPEEVDEFIDKEMRPRIQSLAQTVARLNEAKIHKFGQQQRMPF